jgi:hypothetical protein
VNQTEAWEWVLGAAEGLIYHAEKQGLPDDEGLRALRKAVPKVKPKIERMRARLDDSRARRAGKPKLPAWMKP